VRNAAAAGRAKPPRVLVILVANDGAQWLRQCLFSLSRQTHPRISVLAVDNASTDGSPESLEAALGPDRVIRLDRNVGFAAAVSHAMRAPEAREADYVLLLHDDTALAPDAIASLVEAAERIDGAGVVGPKVVDWDEPQVLRDIGQSTDRFGYPYSPLEESEIDHGQYARVREVMFVSSCAMLLSRGAWSRTGPPDERLDSQHDALDLCWRARLAGFRVLMTPRAVARHRRATERRERAPATGRRRDRYQRERAAMASMLKNYGLMSLVWVLPLYLVQGGVRVALLALSRRFEDAYQVLAAWGWNLTHLPGTLARRVRTQATRTTPDRQVQRYMAPAAIRLRKWAMTAAEALLPARSEPVERRLALHTRAIGFAGAHPVVVAWIVAGVVALVGYRGLFGASPLSGGALAAFPRSAGTFFEEFASGLRSTGLGGSQAASPALGFLGLGSLLTFGSPGLFQKLLLLSLPAAGAVGCYRSVRALTGGRVPAVASAACYAVSAVMLWSLSEGRIPALVFLAGLPWLARKLGEAFLQRRTAPALRWIVGAGLGLAVLTSFYPGTVLAAALLAAGAALLPDEADPEPRRAAASRQADGHATAAPRLSVRRRGLVLVAAAAGVAALAVFPLTLELLRAGGDGLGNAAGTAAFFSLARLSPAPAPGSWLPAFFLPVAAALGLVFASNRFARSAGRAMLLGVTATYLAWLSAAGFLPSATSNAVAFLGVAAVSYATLVGIGLGSVLGGVSLSAFGHRQLGAASMTAVIGIGLLFQTSEVVAGGWAIGGPERLRASYLAVGGSSGERFRVLWLGRPGGAAFVPPGGESDANLAAGAASVRFALRGPAGASMLDTGRPASGPGYDYLRRQLTEILAGRTSHAGALLGPLGIRFIVAGPGDLPPEALSRLRSQLDLEPVPAEDLTIFRNDKAVAPASAVEDPEWVAAALTGPSGVPGLPVPDVAPLAGPAKALHGVAPSDSMVLLSQQFDPRWRLVPASGGAPAPPVRAFGWAIGFRPNESASSSTVRFGGQAVRTLQISLLCALWVVGLWITRRPVRAT
jgi:GT2 family glycosyltransferase